MVPGQRIQVVVEQQQRGGPVDIVHCRVEYSQEYDTVLDYS